MHHACFGMQSVYYYLQLIVLYWGQQSGAGSVNKVEIER